MQNNLFKIPEYRFSESAQKIQPKTINIQQKKKNPFESMMEKSAEIIRARREAEEKLRAL